MWTICYNSNPSKNPTANSITVNELSRDVYICGKITEASPKFQEYFLARFNQHGDRLNEFTMGSLQTNHALDVCKDIDVGETGKGYVFSVGTMRDSGGTMEALIVRNDADLSNALYYTWGGIGQDDVAATVRTNMWGSKVYVMGHTKSFNQQNDFDHFIMKMNYDLEIDSIRMLVRDVTDETISNMVMSRYDYYQMGVGVMDTKGLDSQWTTINYVVKWDENGGFDSVEFGNYNRYNNQTGIYNRIVQIDIDYTDQYYAMCGTRANAAYFIRGQTATMTLDVWRAMGIPWYQYAVTIKGCQWVPSTIRTSEGSAFVVFGDHRHNADISATYTSRNFYFIKLDYDMWIRDVRIFGYHNTWEYATSFMYLDQYGIMYFAGTTDDWCAPYTGQTSLIIFKNSFDFDLWSGHANANYYDSFIIAYPGYGVAYPNYWYDDANVLDAWCTWFYNKFFTATTYSIADFYHKFESNQYVTATSTSAISGVSTYVLFSDFQFQNGELDFQFYTNTYNRVRIPRTCFKGQSGDYGANVYYTHEHNSIYNIGSMSLNTYISDTDNSNYLYNETPIKGVQFYRMSEYKQSDLIKNSLFKVKINDPDMPKLLYRIGNQRILVGTTYNWNMNTNFTVFSGCDKFFFYSQDGTTIPKWLDFNPYSGITGKNQYYFYVSNPKPSGTYEIKVTCMDAYESKVNTTFKITIYNNAPYAIQTIGTQYASAGNSFSLDLKNYYTDSDISNGQSITYSITANTPSTWPSWLSYEPNQGLLFAVIPSTGLSTKLYSFNLLVSDGELTVSETFKISINSNIYMTYSFESKFSGTNGRIMANCSELFTLDISQFFTDPDGDTLTYTILRQNGTELPGWLAVLNGKTLQGMPFESDSEMLNIIIKADDSKGSTLSVPMTIEINCKPVDLGKLGDTLIMTTQQTFTFNFNSYFEDPNGHNLYFEVSGPTWMTVSNGVFTAIPENIGLYQMTLKVCDVYYLCLEKSLTLDVLAVNIPPRIKKQMDDVYVYTKSNFVFNVPGDIFEDLNGDILSMSARQQPTQYNPNGQDLPSWLTFSSTTNTFSGYSNTTQFLRIQLFAGDNYEMQYVYFRLYVQEDSAPVQNNQIADQYSWSETAWSFTIPLDAFRDADFKLLGDEAQLFTYNANLVENQELPNWLQFTQNNRSFYAQETVTGTYMIEISATDLQGNTNYMTFELMVYDQIFDKYNIYYSGVIIVVIAIVTFVVLVFIVTIQTYFKVKNTREINDVKLQKMLGSNPTRFIDRPQKVSQID
eukprot:403357060